MKKNNSKIWIFSLTIMGLAFLTMSGCKKSDDSNSNANALVITTNAVTNITSSTATCGGNISSDGGKTIDGRGVCWGTAQNPTVSKSTFDGPGKGSFTSSITGLTSNTTYYVRAYAASGTDIFYGNQVSFKTTSKGVSSLSCSIDGVPYTASSINAQSISGKVGISGMSGATKSILLWLPDPFTTGSHALSAFGDYMGQYAPSSSTIYTSSSGTIVISEYDASTGKIKGTFNFEATDNSTTVSVTNGQFEVYK